MTGESYSKALGTAFVAILALVWAAAFWLQAPDGDLARVGGFPENQFHWKSPQPAFRKNLFTVTKHLDGYDRYYDVVVLGDSFSFDQEARGFAWQNFFIARTGLSMIVLDARSYFAQSVIDSPAFRKFPPRVFVYESVERYVQWRTSYFEDPEGHPPAMASWRPVPPPAPLAEPVAQAPDPPPSLDPEDVLGLAGAALKRRIGLNSLVVDVPLATSGLFTSDEDRTLLVYFDEYRKNDLTTADVGSMRKGIAALRERVESNGVTRFVLLIAPDKSSIYAPYIPDAGRATRNLIAEAAMDPSLPVIRTDQILGAAIKAGAPDIYLPSDSHWGSTGHRLVADSLADFLGFPRRNPQQDIPE
jgi:hypothetical protein